MDLKPYFDAARAANDEVMKIVSEIDALFTSGTNEGIQQAMTRRGELEDAQAKATEAERLYEAMKAAWAQGDNAAAKFVPVDETAAKEASGARAITRAEYEAMSFENRHAFFKSGGTIVDNRAE
jgi:hypothetical protein